MSQRIVGAGFNLARIVGPGFSRASIVGPGFSRERIVGPGFSRAKSVTARIVVLALALLSPSPLSAQVFSERGFVEARGTFYPEEAANDTTLAVGDVLAREELFFRPAGWIQFGVGADLRANSHDQVEDDWRLDWDDRTILRPRLAMRRLSATLTGGGFTLDVGKQFIRWGRADIIYPTDRFGARDFLNVIDSEVLAVIGARAAFQAGSETFEGVWVPHFTPSRVPLVDQRWTVLPPEAAGVTLLDAGSVFPERAQYGARWRHTGSTLETALSYFDGFNHQPYFEVTPLDATTAQVTRRYPRIRMFGGDAAIPGGWATLKLEAAYVRSLEHETEDYVLYAIEIERQVGEWLVDVGYAGDHVTNAQNQFAFAPDRGIAKSIIGRVAYTVDPRRTFAVEGAVRQTGDGYFGKAEYSQAFGQHWRLTLAGVGIGGEPDDFLGQYQNNSNASVGMRLSF
jgi:hypothetical protein